MRVKWFFIPVLCLVLSPGMALASSITLQTGIADVTAPNITSYAIYKQVLLWKETQKLHVNATDNQEIWNIWATFRFPNGTSINYTLALASGSNASGMYSMDFTETSAYGNYNVTRLFANDSASNTTVELPSGLEFSVATLCGNLMCEEGESSASCPFDCGEGISPRGGGGGGAGEAGAGIAQGCVQNWVCGGWSECSGGSQTRSCSDFSSCGSLEGKPAEEQDCISKAPPEQPEEGPATEAAPSIQTPLGFWALLALPVGAFALYITYRVYTARQRKRGKMLRRIPR